MDLYQIEIRGETRVAPPPIRLSLTRWPIRYTIRSVGVIRTRAIRRAGELMAQFQAKNQWEANARGGTSPGTQREAAAEAGFSKRQERQARKIGEIPTSEFLRYVYFWPRHAVAGLAVITDLTMIPITWWRVFNVPHYWLDKLPPLTAVTVTLLLVADQLNIACAVAPGDL